jgi:hypothetical protein
MVRLHSKQPAYIRNIVYCLRSHSIRYNLVTARLVALAFIQLRVTMPSLVAYDVPYRLK